jgi:hypothetical protein
MRKYKDRHVTGACGCCLIPFVILLIIFVAAVVFTSLVWHATMPSNFGWGPMRHHFDAYRAGFQQGDVTGQQYAARGQAEPTEEDLNDLARSEAQRLHVTRGRNEWIKGFRDGFTRGFESFSRQALFTSSRSNLTC